MDGLAFDVDLTPKGGNNAFHVPNPEGSDFRRVFVRTPNERSPLTTRIQLVEIHHGTMMYEGEKHKATLLVLDIRFQSRVQDRRYTSARVTLEFFDAGKRAQRDPAVVRVVPDAMHWVHRSSFERTTRAAATLGANAGFSGVVGGEGSLSWEREDKVPLKFKATVSGSRGYSRGKAGDENAVTWAMDENQSEADGIPSFLQTAVLLRRRTDQPFIVKLRVDSTVDLVSQGLRALPLTTDKDKVVPAIVVKPAETQIRSSAATGITQDDLAAMERLPMEKYFTVSMAELEQNVPPLEPALQPSDQSGPISSDHADPTQSAGGPPSPAGPYVSGKTLAVTPAGSSADATVASVTRPLQGATTGPLQGAMATAAVDSTSTGSTSLGTRQQTAAKDVAEDEEEMAPLIATVVAAAQVAARAALAAAEAAQASARAAEAAANSAEAAAKAVDATARLVSFAQKQQRRAGSGSLS